MKKIMIGKNEIIYSSNLEKVAKGAGINLSGSILGKAIVFINTLLLAKLLTTSELGVFFLGLSITTITTIMALMGLRIGTIRFVSIYSAKDDLDSVIGTVLTAAVITFLCSIVVALVLFATRDWLSTSVFGKPDLAGVLFIFLFAVPFEATCKIFLAATQGLKFMHYTVYIEQLLALLLRLIFIIVLVLFLNMGIQGAALAYLFSAIISMFAALFFCNREIPFIMKSCKAKIRVKELISFSLPMLPSSVILNVSKQVDILLLGWLGSSASVGIYTIAVRFINFAEVVFKAFQTIFNPLVADLWTRKEYLQLDKLFNLATKWSFTMSLPLFLIFIFFPSFFMGLFSKEIGTGAICLSTLALAHLFSSLSVLTSSMIFMYGRADVALANNIIFIISNSFLNYILIPIYGVFGAALAHGISICLLATLRFVEVLYMMKMHPFHLSLLKPIFASIISFSPIVAYFGIDGAISWLALVSSFILISLLFFAIMLLLKLDDDDLFVAELLRCKVAKNIYSYKRQ